VRGTALGNQVRGTGWPSLAVFTLIGGSFRSTLSLQETSAA
jgi:hypothetical protein